MCFKSVKFHDIDPPFRPRHPSQLSSDWFKTSDWLRGGGVSRRGAETTWPPPPSANQMWLQVLDILFFVYMLAKFKVFYLRKYQTDSILTGDWVVGIVQFPDHSLLWHQDGGIELQDNVGINFHRPRPLQKENLSQINIYAGLWFMDF